MTAEMMAPDGVQSAPIEWEALAQMRTHWGAIGAPTLPAPVSTRNAAVTAPMSANEALEMAARRGLDLQRSDNQSGYKHVVINRAAGKDRMFQLQVRGDGQQTHLGSFATPEEAALQYVMREAGGGSVQGGDEPAARAQEALDAAEQEGLALLRSAHGTGFRFVSYDKSKQARPYVLQVTQGGQQKVIGRFVTAEEAALDYARREASGEFAETPSMTAAEALAAAEREGLSLSRSNNTSGFKHVRYHKERRARPYQLLVTRGGQQKHLGSFATAEEAALEHARLAQFAKKGSCAQDHAHANLTGGALTREEQRAILQAMCGHQSCSGSSVGW